MKTKLLPLLVALMCATQVFAEDFVANGITYHILNSNSVSVTSSAIDTIEYMGSMTIPSSVSNKGKTYQVTAIGGSAFYACRGLTSVTIPNSVTSIGNYAFYMCEELTSVNMSNNLKSIGQAAFLYCGQLTNITIPYGVTTLGNSAFSCCYNLPTITIPNSVVSIGNTAFRECRSLTSITIPNSLTLIGVGAFNGCSNLETITVNAGNPTYHSAGNCLIETSSATMITGCKGSIIPTDGSVTAIGDNAFAENEGLTTITIPEGVTSIGNNAFFSCSYLTSITIPNSVIFIGNNAFADCPNLTEPIYTASIFAFLPTSYSGAYTIPDGIQIIAGNAFRECTQLTAVTIPNSVTSIGNQAFYGCINLPAIAIPNSVTTIGSWTFYGCEKFTEITIPNSVTSIGDHAFLSCTGLKKIICLAVNPPAIDENTFLNIDRNLPLYVPEASINAYEEASYWSEFTNIQAVVEGVEIVPDKNSATITWSATAGASSYILTLYADMNQTEGIGTFTFDAQGQLTNSSRKKPTAAYNVEEDFSYTVTGLDANTTYFYVLNSCDATNSVLDSKSGQFTTTNTTAINDITVQKERTNKVFENGTIYIRRNGEKYTVDGIRVM